MRRFYCYLAVIALGAAGDVRAALNSGFEGFAVVPDQELEQMRGGFETVSDGLQLTLSFSIARASFINGQLVSESTLSIPSFSALENGGAVAVGFEPVTLIQNGAGNSFALPGIRDLPAHAMTLIQNTLDNQLITNFTVINASVTSRDFLHSLAVQDTLNRMTFHSLR